MTKSNAQAAYDIAFKVMALDEAPTPKEKTTWHRLAADVRDAAIREAMEDYDESIPETYHLSPKELAKFACLDCGINVVESGDWYLASHEIWEGELGLGWDDNLCVACLEARLGRKLRPGVTGGDLTLASTHFDNQKKSSKRLLELWHPEKRRTKKAAA